MGQPSRGEAAEGAGPSLFYRDYVRKIHQDGPGQVSAQEIAKVLDTTLTLDLDPGSVTQTMNGPTGRSAT